MFPYYLLARMNVFVTGGAGYIGSVCTEELLNAGHAVTVYDNLTEGHRSAVDPRAKFILGQAGAGRRHPQRRQIREARRHPAFRRQRARRRIHDQPEKYFHNNVVNGLKLADAAVECGVKKFVFSSTCATYGPPDRVPMTEDLPQRPINPYGESKLMFEKMLIWYQQIYKLEFIAFRYFNAAGASEKFGEHHRIETHLIPNVLIVALGQKPHARFSARIIPRPTAPASAITSTSWTWRRRTSSACTGQTGFYNLGNGDGYSVRQVIEMCEKVTGKKIPAIEKPRRPGDPPHSSPPPKRPSANSAGNRNFPSWKTSSPPRGTGIKSIRTGIRINGW